jgi:hypothetical protein
MNSTPFPAYTVYYMEHIEREIDLLSPKIRVPSKTVACNLIALNSFSGKALAALGTSVSNTDLTVHSIRLMTGIRQFVKGRNFVDHYYHC